MLHDGLTLYEEDIVVVLPRVSMSIEARLDGQGGFRAETRKGRALKELDTMRVVLEALGSVTLWSSPNLTQGSNITLAARVDYRRFVSYVACKAKRPR